MRQDEWVDSFPRALAAYERLKFILGDLWLERDNFDDNEIWQLLPQSPKIDHQLRLFAECSECWPEHERDYNQSWFTHYILRKREDRLEWLAKCAADQIEDPTVLRNLLKEMD